MSLFGNKNKREVEEVVEKFVEEVTETVEETEEIVEKQDMGEFELIKSESEVELGPGNSYIQFLNEVNYHINRSNESLARLKTEVETVSISPEELHDTLLKRRTTLEVLKECFHEHYFSLVRLFDNGYIAKFSRSSMSNYCDVTLDYTNQLLGVINDFDDFKAELVNKNYREKHRTVEILKQKIVDLDVEKRVVQEELKELGVVDDEEISE